MLQFGHRATLEVDTVPRVDDVPCKESVFFVVLEHPHVALDSIMARLRVTYRLACTGSGDALNFAQTIAREQTVEVPPGVGSEALESRMLGRVEELEPAPEREWGAPRAASAPPGRSARRFAVCIAYPLASTGTELTQILNVVYGNVSLMDGVRVVDLTLPPDILDALPGPRFGIAGIRALTGATQRPLVGAAIKPLGLTPRELARLAAAFARAGVDIVKDDHGLTDQPAAPFTKRVAAVADAVAAANAATGGRTRYLPNVTGPIDTLEERLDHVVSHGLSGVLLSPSLAGLDTMRAIAAGPRDLAVMAHPSHAQAAPRRPEGISPDVLYGTLYRAAGADMVVYPDTGGRYKWPKEACKTIAERLRAPLGSIRQALPTPAGGMNIDAAARNFARHGQDAMLLIGGSLLMQKDLEGAARRLVETAAYAGEASP